MLGPGITARALYGQYMGFGDDPFIMPVDQNNAPVDFGGWAYAEQRCEAIIAALPLPEHQGKSVQALTS